MIEANPRQREVLNANAAPIPTLQLLQIAVELADLTPAAGERGALSRRDGGLRPRRSRISLTSPPNARAFPRRSRRWARTSERTSNKLANPDFVARAPEEVVEENRERLADAESARAKLQSALERLESVS